VQHQKTLADADLQKLRDAYVKFETLRAQFSEAQDKGQGLRTAFYQMKAQAVDVLGPGAFPDEACRHMVTGGVHHSTYAVWPRPGRLCGQVVGHSAMRAPARTGRCSHFAIVSMQELDTGAAKEASTAPAFHCMRSRRP